MNDNLHYVCTWLMCMTATILEWVTVNLCVNKTIHVCSFLEYQIVQIFDDEKLWQHLTNQAC